MSPLSLSTAFRLLFQLSLVQFAAMCPVFPQLQQTLVSPLPPFSCPFPPFLPLVLDHCLFPARFAVFLKLAAVDVFLCAQVGTLSSIPSTFGSCLLVHCPHYEFRGFSSSNVSSTSVPAAMPILHLCARVNVFHLGCRMCRDLVYDDVLQRDEQLFVRQCGATESIVQQNSRALTFSSARVFSSSQVFPNLPSYSFDKTRQ